METLHFPSAPLPAPCTGCGTLLCAECARHGLTAVHFSTDGICTYGHRLEVPLADRLAEWIKAEGIEGSYPPDGIASRVVAQVHASYLTAWLDQGGTPYLRDMCARIKDEDDMTPEERAAENYWHGHGKH